VDPQPVTVAVELRNAVKRDWGRHAGLMFEYLSRST
jgi:hypothetical protein